MLKIGFSDMMCDVGNAAIKDAIANIARNRKVLHFLSCIARFLGYFSGLTANRPSGFPDTGAFLVPNPARSPRSRLLDNIGNSDSPIRLCSGLLVQWAIYRQGLFMATAYRCRFRNGYLPRRRTQTVLLCA
jgi:hypothetical protein